VIRGQFVEATQMLDNRDAGAEQDAVRRTRQVSRVIDIIRIDADQYRAFVGQKLRRIFRQKGMTFEILQRAPVSRPTSMNQDRFALYFEFFKRARLNRSAADATGALPIYDHAIKVGQRTQR